METQQLNASLEKIWSQLRRFERAYNGLKPTHITMHYSMKADLHRIKYSNPMVIALQDNTVYGMQIIETNADLENGFVFGLTL